MRYHLVIVLCYVCVYGACLCEMAVRAEGGKHFDGFKGCGYISVNYVNCITDLQEKYRSSFAFFSGFKSRSDPNGY